MEPAQVRNRGLSFHTPATFTATSASTPTPSTLVQRIKADQKGHGSCVATFQVKEECEWIASEWQENYLCNVVWKIQVKNCLMVFYQS